MATLPKVCHLLRRRIASPEILAIDSFLRGCQGTVGGFAGRKVSVTVVQLCCCGSKTATDNRLEEQV